MKRFQSPGVILKRVNYGEADRIITFLTPENGKLSAMAKGVRKPKSKLAGGIELFAINDLTLLEGRGELHTLISSRAKQSFRNVTRDYDVVQVGYKAIQLVEKGTEDEASKDYFDLLADTFGLLDGGKHSPEVAEGWFSFQFLKLQGNAPNLTHDVNGQKLSPDKTYSFTPSEGSFNEDEGGKFDAQAIKAWRVLLGATADNLGKVKDLDEALKPTFETLQAFVEYTQ